MPGELYYQCCIFSVHHTRTTRDESRNETQTMGWVTPDPSICSHQTKLSTRCNKGIIFTADPQTGEMARNLTRSVESERNSSTGKTQSRLIQVMEIGFCEPKPLAHSVDD